jgi:7,8-dihydropterin-6-yl-methyl-4-(beta-D-ribofuranosyl)aminobenzene 5'-phosphate synthase
VTEKNAGPFFFDSECTIPDRIADDQALFVQSGKGWVVFLGCAHAGLVNTLDCVCRMAGTSMVFAVIGGMHLLHADLTRLEATAESLARQSIDGPRAGIHRHEPPGIGSTLRHEHLDF